MGVFVLAPRSVPVAATIPAAVGSPWPSRLLVAATITLLGLAAFVAGRRFGAYLVGGMDASDVAVYGLAVLWTPVYLALPLLASRRGGAR